MTPSPSVPPPVAPPPVDAAPTLDEASIYALERPVPKLLVFYALSSLMLGPFFFFMLIPLYFRYQTLRYQFDQEGVSMKWGILFRREINLTYARIQDIHLVSNALERWLGLARIKIQTASGSAKAEMTIEGLEQFEALRTFLYDRMRGAQDDGRPSSRSEAESGMTSEHLAQLVATLEAVTQEVRGLRGDLAQLRGQAGPTAAASAEPGEAP